MAEGGVPPPSVHWLRNGELLDSTAEEREDRVVNQIILHKVRESERVCACDRERERMKGWVCVTERERE